MRLCESVIPCDCDTAEIPPDHATVMMFEYYPELPVPMRELLLNFAGHVRETPPEMRRQPNTAFARITTRLWLLPNSVDRKIKYFACTACAVYNVARIVNIRPASLSNYSILLKVTPKGTIRVKPPWLMTDCFTSGKRRSEDQGSILPIPDDFCCDADVHAELYLIRRFDCTVGIHFL